ncbi:MAG: hypothetical protein WCC14_13260, partial [Acidobacteriaceae bacterium]
GVAGQQASVLLNNSTFPSTIPGSCWAVTVSILNPDGSTLSSTNFCPGYIFLGPVTLPTTGSYTLVIAPANNGTGSATAVLSLFAEQSLSVTPISAGTTGTVVTINTPGQEADLTFSGTAGQQASLLLANSTFPANVPGSGASLNVSILNPDGSTLTSATFSSGYMFLSPATLPATGTYTVVIAPVAGATGSVSVALSLFTVETGNITSGTAVPVTINAPGQDEQLSFTGTGGQQASVLLTNSTFPSDLPGSCSAFTVSILNPNGSTLTSANFCPGYMYLNAVTLPSTGTYSLVIAPVNGSTGSVTVLLSTFYEQTGTITLGTATPLTISIPGQDSQLTFSGTEGQSATVSLANATFPSNIPGSCTSVTVSILNPDGSTLQSTNLCGPGNLSTNPVSLPSTGTYTLVTAPADGGTGSTSVTLTLQ